MIHFLIKTKEDEPELYELTIQPIVEEYDIRSINMQIESLKEGIKNSKEREEREAKELKAMKLGPTAEKRKLLHSKEWFQERLKAEEEELKEKEIELDNKMAKKKARLNTKEPVGR